MNTSEAQSLTAFGMRSKFLIGLACIFMCFCILTTILLYFYEKKILEEETFRKTELVMAAVESTREYVREVLRPKMFDVLDDEAFVLEAMSTSYITRVVMERFNQHLPEFAYRRVAVAARNPDFEANDLERRMIRYFSEQQEEDRWHGIVKTERGRYYMSFRPVRFSDSCLHCHGDPHDAPAAIIELYGPNRGFQRQPDVVSGVQSVGIPVDFGLGKIMDVAWAVFTAAVLIAFSLYGIIWLFFNTLVVRSLRQLLDIFRDTLRDAKGVGLYEQARSKDEMDEMSLAMQGVAKHLRETHKSLEDYAQNLEQKVAERTSALEESQQLLRRQVAERSQELRTLNTIAELITQSVHLQDILPRVLRQALEVIPADGAGIYLLDRERALLRLQCRENADALDTEIPLEPGLCLPLLEEKTRDFDGFITEAAWTHMNLLGNEPVLLKNLNVPLCCRRQVLGVMTFLGAAAEQVDTRRQELLFSIGHQIGVTIESLHNIASLVHSKELLQSVFDGITDVVVLLDREQRIRMVNPAFLQRHGISLEQALGHRLGDLPLQTGCPFNRCITSLSLPDGQPSMEQVQTVEGCIYEVSLYPILSEQGAVNDIICYAKDITEQKLVERKIQQTEKLVSLGQLAAGVAHEINNPLGVILCYTDILKAELAEGPSRQREDIELIEKHARSCQRIVADLLNFARSQKSDKSSASINVVVEEVVAMVRQQFLKNQITIALELSPELPDLRLNADHMRQVFLNLLMNASQAIGRDGSIRIVSRPGETGDKVEVMVEDTGAGIDAEILTKIFDPFFTTKPPGSGTGLGLSVSYGIVREHEGDIRAESTAGRGTAFLITLPIPAPAANTKEITHEPAAPADH